MRKALKLSNDCAWGGTYDREKDDPMPKEPYSLRAQVAGAILNACLQGLIDRDLAYSLLATLGLMPEETISGAISEQDRVR